MKKYPVCRTPRCVGMAAPRRAASDFFNELLVGLALLLARRLPRGSAEQRGKS